jgi:hypothetical protein
MQETDELDAVTGFEWLIDNQVSAKGKEAHSRVSRETLRAE